MKNKFKSYTFWLALVGAVIILINTLGTTFGFGVDEVAITSIATAVLGIFVTLGIVRKDSKNEQEKTKDEQVASQSLENTSVKENQDDKTDQNSQG